MPEDYHITTERIQRFGETLPRYTKLIQWISTQYCPDSTSMLQLIKGAIIDVFRGDEGCAYFCAKGGFSYYEGGIHETMSRITQSINDQVIEFCSTHNLEPFVVSYEHIAIVAEGNTFKLIFSKLSQ